MSGRSSWGAEFWEDALRRFQGSGMTVAEFCELEGCSVATFYGWRRRLAEKPRQTAFTEVVVDTAPSAAIEIELPGDICVRLRGAVATEQLDAVLDCLERRRC